MSALFPSTDVGNPLGESLPSVAIAVHIPTLPAGTAFNIVRLRADSYEHVGLCAFIDGAICFAGVLLALVNSRSFDSSAERAVGVGCNSRSKRLSSVSHKRESTHREHQVIRVALLSALSL